MSADYTVQGDLAVITMNNPPINGLGLSTRLAIVAGLEKALADDNIKAIILTGAGKAFSGGADIERLARPKPFKNPICSV